MAITFDTIDGNRIGPRMRAAVKLVDGWFEGAAPSKKQIAEHVGPHGSLKYGYRTVNRSISAGLLAHPDPNHPDANPHGRGAVTLTEKGERYLDSL